MSDSDSRSRKVVATNRKARRNFSVLERVEAGLVLKGTEVKSLRAGNVAFRDAYAAAVAGEVWIRNLYIGPYESGGRWNHDPSRPRKLLLHKREILRLIAASEQKALALVPLDLYFRKGTAKVTLALCRGRTHRDRREELRRRTMELEAKRAMKERR